MGTAGEGHALLDYAAVAFGYRYRSAAIVGAPADDRPALAPAELTGQPGTRAPHVWLERDGARLSTVDLFGRGSVLLTDAEGGAWIEAARSLIETAVETYRIGGDGDVADPEGRWTATYGVTNGGAVLVRPNGFVAWRVERAVVDPARVLSAVLLELLAREQVMAAAR